MIKFAELKKLFIYTFVGSLVAAAIVAVVTVLIGQFNEITGRVFLTLFLAIIHSLISLTFIWDDSRRNTFNKLAFFTNSVFILIVLSFFTSVFGVWKIFSGETIWHLYTTYFYLAFAALHADILSKAMHREKYMDYVIYANYLFIIIVVSMLQPIVYIHNSLIVLAPVYFRFLGAAAIIDGTLSILTIIFFKLYMHKHPEITTSLENEVPTKAGQTPRRRLSMWVWILIIYLVFQIGFPIIIVLTGFFAYLGQLR